MTCMTMPGTTCTRIDLGACRVRAIDALCRNQTTSDDDRCRQTETLWSLAGCHQRCIIRVSRRVSLSCTRRAATPTSALSRTLARVEPKRPGAARPEVGRSVMVHTTLARS